MVSPSKIPKKNPPEEPAPSLPTQAMDLVSSGDDQLISVDQLDQIYSVSIHLGIYDLHFCVVL